MGTVANVVKKVGGGVAKIAKGDVLGGLKGVAGGIGGIASGISGKSGSTNQTLDQTQTTQNVLGQRSANEQYYDQLGKTQLGGLVSGGINNYQQASKDANSVDAMFRNLLTQTMQNDGRLSPDQLKSSIDYVDQTFTNPAKIGLNESLNQYQSGLDSRAAALGRQVDDQGYANNFASNAARENANLQAQRGALIAQRGDELSYNRPMQQAQLGLQGSQFFNNKANQMFNNQIQLANQATVMNNNLFNQRAQQGQQVAGNTRNVSEYSKASLGDRVSGIANGATQAVESIGKLFK